MLYKLSGVLIGLYGLVLFMLFSFSLLWDHKGATSMSDNTATDWVLILWFVVSIPIIFYGSKNCFLKKHATTYTPLFLVGFIVSVNTILFLVASVGGIFIWLHLIPGIGVFLWFGINKWGQTR